MREQLKEVWRAILTRDYSEDTIATIMTLLTKTNKLQKTLDQVIDILNQNLTEKETYQKLNRIEM